MISVGGGGAEVTVGIPNLEFLPIRELGFREQMDEVLCSFYVYY